VSINYHHALPIYECQRQLYSLLAIESVINYWIFNRHAESVDVARVYGHYYDITGHPVASWCVKTIGGFELGQPFFSLLNDKERKVVWPCETNPRIPGPNWSSNSVRYYTPYTYRSACITEHFWFVPLTCPTNLSALHKVGSILVPTPITNQ